MLGMMSQNMNVRAAATKLCG